MRSQILAAVLGVGSVTAGVQALPQAPSVCDSPAGHLAMAARNAGLSSSSVVTAVAVGLAESNGRPDAVGDISIQDSTWSESIGAWQVRSLRDQLGTGGVRDRSTLFDLQANARAMVVVSGNGSTWAPWSTFTNGAYRDRLGEADAVASCAGAVPSTGYRPPAGRSVANLVDTAVTGAVDAACGATAGAVWAQQACSTVNDAMTG